MLAIQLKWVFSSDDAPLLVIMMVLYYYNAPFYLYFELLFSLSVVQCFFCDCGCKVVSYLVSRFGFKGVDISYVLKKPTWQMVLLTNFVKGFGFCLSRYLARELPLYIILNIKIKHLFLLLPNTIYQKKCWQTHLTRPCSWVASASRSSSFRWRTHCLPRSCQDQWYGDTSSLMARLAPKPFFHPPVMEF